MEMTEDEKLLLKDLCARLPYGVKIHCNDGVNKEDDKLWSINTFWGAEINAKYSIECVKPYLRPMSSITEEEKEGYNNARSDYYDDLETYDWLNEHHFDYRGLIEKGLALEAPKYMYNDKKQ